MEDNAKKSPEQEYTRREKNPYCGRYKATSDWKVVGA
jgi:hypothetical protein